MKAVLILFAISFMIPVSFAQSDDDPSFDGTIFFDGFSEACTLPCWNGLVVGESDKEALADVLTGLDFDNGGHRPFFDESYDGYGVVQVYRDEMNNDYLFALGISGYLDASDTLQALVIEWVSGADARLFVPDIFKEYGTPSEVFVSLSRLPDASPTLLTLQYAELNTLFQYYLWTEEGNSKLCVLPTGWGQEGDVVIFIMNIGLFNLESLMSVERSGFGIEETFTLEDLAGISPQEFTEGVLESEDSNFCFEFEYPR
jgi:hypothetical protein